VGITKLYPVILPRNEISKADFHARGTSPDTIGCGTHPSKTAKGGAASVVMAQSTKNANVGQPAYFQMSLQDKFQISL
jgi:hypothetical protein